jgi:hypothetical protein
VVVAFQGGLTAKSRGWFGDVMGVVAGAVWGLTTEVIRATRLIQILPEKLLLYRLIAHALEGGVSTALRVACPYDLPHFGH